MMRQNISCNIDLLKKVYKDVIIQDHNDLNPVSLVDICELCTKYRGQNTEPNNPTDLTEICSTWSKYYSVTDKDCSERSVPLAEWATMKNPVSVAISESIL
ncbi:hypothetical protein PoB_000073800 [Plakobranchus ocellatus]|uniref:Uncharacterized protein n=1 Tax=Plakobranchus ocellatus TaxID=259542 RepID=A0AAV3XVC8_9GAST|nr:hypothetical protein PoB_000073800 [Plakobranchus ocellatus]